MKTHRLVLVGIVVASFTGCYRIRYINNTRAEDTPALEHWHHNAISGLWEISQPVNVSEACPQGFAEVKNEVTFLNGLASWAVQTAVNVPLILATSNIDPNTGTPTTPGYSIPFTVWSPQSVSVTCSARAAAVEPTSGRRQAE
jgi:hypothetical protein